MSKDQQRVRLNLSMTKRVHERIERLLESSEAESITEVIRRALAVYELCIDTVNDGGRILIEDKDGSVSEMRLLP